MITKPSWMGNEMDLDTIWSFKYNLIKQQEVMCIRKTDIFTARQIWVWIPNMWPWLLYLRFKTHTMESYYLPQISAFQCCSYSLCKLYSDSSLLFIFCHIVGTKSYSMDEWIYIADYNKLPHSKKKVKLKIIKIKIISNVPVILSVYMWKIYWMCILQT